MKKITLVVLLVILTTLGFGQSSPGDIAIIAANVDGGDDFAFVALVDIAANKNIYFTDNEWNGTAFDDLNEGELTWTNGGSVLPAGSVVVFTDPSSSGTVNIGSFSESGWNLNASDEWFYALLEEPATSYSTPPTFLAAFATDAGSGWLSNTGLTEGTTAIDFNNDHDGFKYTGSRTGQASFSDYLTLIYNSSNWQDENDNGELILPISIASFAISGVNQNPVVSNIAFSPLIPNSSNTVSVSADITDSDGTLVTVECHWGTVSGSLGNTINMSVSSGVNYSTDADIPAQANGTTVFFEVHAVDDDAGSTTSVEQTYTVNDEFGNIIITEIMQDPNDTGDSDGEWFEVFNTTASNIDIDGWVISDAGSDSHTINNGGALNVTAGGFLILGINGTTTANGGVPLDYQYSGIILSNSDDELILTNSSAVEIARVEWDGGANWPDPTGASMIFTGLSTDNNNDGSNWTTSFLRENNFTNPVGNETDFGSPGINGMYQNLISSTSWTGTGNWSEGNAVGSSNWTNGSPGSAVDVTINGNITVDLQSPDIAKCKDLNISIGGIAAVDVGKLITVLGNLSNNGSLTLESNATGNASLIVEGTASGNVNVKRYFEAYAGAGDGWHYISSPVNAMTIAGSDFEPGASDDLYAWDEDDYLWRNYKGGNFPGTTFQNGYGYMVAYSSTVTNTFSGTLNNADISFSNLSKTPSQGDGWHLIGNPFSSAIYWATADWNLANVGAVAKIYNESAGNYLDVSASGIVPSTNGFFIQVSSSVNSFTIPKSSRVHNTTNNYKNMESDGKTETLKLIVNNDNNSFYDVTNIAFRDDADINFEWNYDAHKMFGQSMAPQLWTNINGEDFSTNTLPPVYESMTVDLNFKAGVNSTFHLIPEGMESFYMNSEIYLEDLILDKIVDLRETDIYTFQANTSDDNHRFKLHFYGITHIEDAPSINDIYIYSKENHVIVKMPEQSTKYNIQVYDIMGRKLMDKERISHGIEKFFFDKSGSVLIVRITYNNKVISRKVLINNP